MSPFRFVSAVTFTEAYIREDSQLCKETALTRAFHFN
uniref:Uncharacterized protein n=1 Tax=Anguilla anguilla TaxID=7936 RepID=A0A0E9RDP5_ANGAN